MKTCQVHDWATGGQQFWQTKWRKKEKPTSQRTASCCYSNIVRTTLKHKLKKILSYCYKCAPCLLKDFLFNSSQNEREALWARFSSCKTVCQSFSIHGHVLSDDLCGELQSALLCSTDFYDFISSFSFILYPQIHFSILYHDRFALMKLRWNTYTNNEDLILCIHSVYYTQFYEYVHLNMLLYVSQFI